MRKIQAIYTIQGRPRGIEAQVLHNADRTQRGQLQNNGPEQASQLIRDLLCNFVLERNTQVEIKYLQPQVRTGKELKISWSFLNSLFFFKPCSEMTCYIQVYALLIFCTLASAIKVQEMSYFLPDEEVFTYARRKRLSVQICMIIDY